ncbi:MAG TPA: hypothetical protein VJH95_02620 [Candidatus Nanoarchaeia archaeon]|nr:hypothetical protein [Candidatus Nanoarchaeia archaeon]
MGKIMWCLSKKEGLSFVEPNQNLANAYLLKSEQALESLRINTIKDWRIATAYYTMYFAVYSLLMKIGIKCEIHSCTLAFAKEFLSAYFTKEEIKFFEDALQARTDTQYYVNREVPDEQYAAMVKRAPEVLVKCKSIILKLNEKKVREIRDALGKEVEKKKLMLS